MIWKNKYTAQVAIWLIWIHLKRIEIWGNPPLL